MIVGTGYVGGRQVAAFSQDFMVLGGALGKMHARKIVWAQDYALKNGTPFIGFKDSGGARIQEGVDSLSGYGEVFYRNVVLSGVVPQIAIIAGPCAGGASYSPALMDFIIMTRQNAQMFITGPQVIKSVSGRQVSMDEVGGAEMHASVSGNVHLLADDDRHAIELTRQLLSYIPSNNTEDPPLAAPTLVGRSCAELQRTSLSPQALPQNLRRFSGLRLADPKNRMGIGGAKRPVISTTEIGYVRRSELSAHARVRGRIPAWIFREKCCVRRRRKRCPLWD